MNDRFKFRYVHEDKKKVYNVAAIDFNQKILSVANIMTVREFNYNSLLQCTGLKDRNGTLIYEGDIIEVLPDKEYAIIEWNKEMARFDICIKNSKSIYRFATYCGDELEVIGNIYENPELLKG